MKSLLDCDYSAFISYAHADDALWYQWVTHFRAELEQALRAQLRGVALPRMHLSGDNGPVSGRLSDELLRRIESSFAMIIVVHDNYAQSSWCLKELAYFKSLFGDEGLQQRLYIVSLSEPAMQSVVVNPAWQQLVPGGEQLWIPFNDPADPARPLDIYMAPGLVANNFRVPFERLRNDFAAKLKRAASLPSAAAGHPAHAAHAAHAAHDALPGGRAGAVRSSPGGDPTAAALAAMSVASGAAAPVVLLGFAPPASSAGLADVARQLAAAGLTVRRLQPDAVFSDFAEFAEADHLVLAFDDAPPLLTSVKPGGHLEVQRDAWRDQGRAPDRVHWLDLRAPSGDDTPAVSASPRFVATLGEPVRRLAALLAALRPPPAAAAAAAVPDAAAAGGASGVRIYIESNRHERTLWEPLGEQIRDRWDELFKHLDPDRVPPLTLIPRGLPVDQLDAFRTLDDADGVILLWGQKTADALVAQIDKIEKKVTPGRDAPPGIVAYLMPPQNSSEPVPAWGWQVLRFDARDEDSIAIFDETEDHDLLQRFLKKVFARRRRRELAEAALGGGV